MSRGSPRSRTRGGLVGLALFLLAYPSTVEAADNDFNDGITVDSSIDAPDASPGDGVCADSMGRCTLRSAVQESNATIGVQTILLSAATYLLTVVGASEDTAATGDLDLTDSVIISGVSSDSTVVDANGAAIGDRAFHLKDLSGLGLAVTLEDLAVVNGSVLNVNGGGIFVEAAEGEEGGGPPGAVEEAPTGFGPAEILALEPVETTFSLTVRGVRVAGNVANSNLLDDQGKPVGGSGGGIYSGAALIVEDSEITDNEAAANGGGFYAGGVVTLASSAVTMNTAEGGGGFFETGSHTSFYSECAIVGNNAVGGGGFTTRTQVSLQLTNCTVDGNHATDVGAGVQASGLVNLVYSTVTNNSSGTASPNGGGGLNSFAGGSFRLWSTLVADNLVGTGEGEEPADPEERNCGCTGGIGCSPMVQFLSLGHNLEDIDTCFFDDPDDLPDTPPGIGTLVSADPLSPVIPLLFDSAAVDAGDPAVCPATDQRGVARPIDGDLDSAADCDIGAYEFAPALFSDGFESGDTSAWSRTKSGA